MNFFDCNCMVGRFARPQPGQFWEAAGLERELERCGIERALVFHALAKELDPATGNAALAHELDGRRRLEPCWVAMPHHTGEMPPPEELCNHMAERSVRAVRLFPQVHGYSLAEWCSGELLSTLERRRIPVLLDHEQTTWQEVNSICEAHPDLPLVLVRVSYRAHRSLYPLLARHRNFHLEIGWFATHDAIAECAQRFGAQRLLFGSALPLFTPGGPIANIAYARIRDADKALIAGDNLRRLLGEPS